MELQHVLDEVRSAPNAVPGVTVEWRPASPAWRTAVVSVQLAGGGTVAIREEDGSVVVVVDDSLELALSDAQVVALRHDPPAFLTGTCDVTAQRRVRGEAHWADVDDLVTSVLHRHVEGSGVPAAEVERASAELAGELVTRFSVHHRGVGRGRRWCGLRKRGRS